VRSNLFYEPKGESAQNLRFMEIIDKQFLQMPWYLSFYNTRRPHSSLDGRTPDQAYFKQPMPKAAAA
jgi:hypothetical protein